MKFKNKGRKIYKTKEKNYYGKSPTAKFFSAALTVLFIGGLGFIGYSAAEPFMNFTKKIGDKDDTSSASSASEASENSGATNATAAEISVNGNTELEKYNAAELPVSALSSEASLRSALETMHISEGTEYIQVPLKVSGGMIYYATEVQEAQMSGAVQSSLTLDEIVSEIRTSGYKPSAEISMFSDSITPQTYPEMGYVTAESGSQWIDNSIEAGGKPWTTPQSESTVKYVTDIMQEVTEADFDKIVCTDFKYPYFRDSDKELLSEEVTSPNRFMALTSAANTMYSMSISGGTPMMLGISAVDIIKGNCDVIQPMLLNVNSVVLNIDFDELGDAVLVDGNIVEYSGTAEQKAAKVMDSVKDKLSDYNVAVRLSGQSMTSEELVKVKDYTAAHYDCTSFIIG